MLTTEMREAFYAALLPSPLTVPKTVPDNKKAKRNKGGKKTQPDTQPQPLNPTMQNGESPEASFLRAIMTDMTKADLKKIFPPGKKFEFTIRPKDGQPEVDANGLPLPRANISIYDDFIDKEYALGHTYLLNDTPALPDDPLFTILTKDDKYATSFVGKYAMRMYDSFRACDVDMAAFEHEGPWEKSGAKRWIVSLDKETDLTSAGEVMQTGKAKIMLAVQDEVLSSKVLKEYELMQLAIEKHKEISTPYSGEDEYAEAVSNPTMKKEKFRRLKLPVAKKEESRRVDLPVKKREELRRVKGEEPVEKGDLNTAAMESLIQQVTTKVFDPLDWQGPSWPGSEASVSALPPRQRPLRPSFSADGAPFKEDENDETACTSYVDLISKPPMDFSWYHRKNPNDTPEHEWPHVTTKIWSSGKIRSLSMQEFYDSLNARYPDLEKRFRSEHNRLDQALKALNSHWENMARAMEIFDWFWDEDKRILVKGYSGHHDYERHCDWIDEQLQIWKGIVEDEMAANRKAIESGTLGNREMRYIMVGEQLLKRWKGGQGIMVSKTPSDEELEGPLLGPHTSDGAAHINYLMARINWATKQQHELAASFIPEDDTAGEIYAAGLELENNLGVLRNFKMLIEDMVDFETYRSEIEELNLQEGGTSLVFVEDEDGPMIMVEDEHSRRAVGLWEEKGHEELLMWRKKVEEKNRESTAPTYAKEPEINVDLIVEESRILLEEMQKFKERMDAGL